MRASVCGNTAYVFFGGIRYKEYYPAAVHILYDRSYLLPGLRIYPRRRGAYERGRTLIVKAESASYNRNGFACSILYRLSCKSFRRKPENKISAQYGNSVGFADFPFRIYRFKERYSGFCARIKRNKNFTFIIYLIGLKAIKNRIFPH